MTGLSIKQCKQTHSSTLNENASELVYSIMLHYFDEKMSIFSNQTLILVLGWATGVCKSDYMQDTLICGTRCIYPIISIFCI